ncbi:MAG: sodium/proton antiporter NhaB [Nitrospinae bacterium]|nr:sodium/proton antiporter NhaB [Nitrospinota bacterium]MBF0633697.1 sodium/proton antiporter NhaB [Nitrospinota bacterium]
MRIVRVLAANFMGASPLWYKLTIISFLIINPILLAVFGPFLTGWVLVAQFIFTLAMALKCYPLQPGGLLTIEAIAMGMASTAKVYEEAHHNFPVILLLIFMVASIYFMKDLLLYIFSAVLVRIRSKIAISLMFCMLGAFLSAFLDALTVTAVIMTVANGFYSVYHHYISSLRVEWDSDHSDDSKVDDEHKEDLEEFRGFLRNVLMHGAVGTALGGVTTLVGEPQNLLIAHVMKWSFGQFFTIMSPVTMPVLAVGLLTCVLVEKFKVFGYGHQLPPRAHQALAEFAQKESAKLDLKDYSRIGVQGVMGVALILALAFHVAEVGIIGLTLLIILTAFNGITDEHQIGKAFQEALPFTALLVVFFAVVAVIQEQALFAPIIQWSMEMNGKKQLLAFFTACGLLTAISDNVFVATIYITEAKKAFDAGLMDRAQFDLVAVAINAGTNIPSVATPNGQAAFLFLLTSVIASLIRLSYVRMLILALPYTVTMTGTALAAVLLWL